MIAFVYFLIGLVIAGGFLYAVWTIYDSALEPNSDSAPQPKIDVEEKSWRNFARSRKLTFVTGENYSDTFVTGQYRGHFLVLRTLTKDLGNTNTYISIKKQPQVNSQFDTKARDFLEELGTSPPFKGDFFAEANGDRVYYEQRDVETNSRGLDQIIAMLYQITNVYPRVIKLGGEGVPTLREVAGESGSLQSVCRQMLTDISRETKDRLGPEASKLWCVRCLTKCREIPVDLGEGDSINYYGCRLCGQSQEFLHLNNGVVAILNRQETQEQVNQNDGLRVNWLIRQSLFDFDRVEILEATDEEVERFAMQVNNETDEARKSYYQKMSCLISPHCQLSLNTRRVLEHTFSTVEGTDDER